MYHFTKKLSQFLTKGKLAVLPSMEKVLLPSKSEPELLFDGPKVMTFCLMSKGGVPHFLDSQFWLSTVKYSAFNSLERVTEYSSILSDDDTKSCQQSSAFSGMRCVVSKQKGVDLDK